MIRLALNVFTFAAFAAIVGAALVLLVGTIRELNALGLDSWSSACGRCCHPNHDGPCGRCDCPVDVADLRPR